MKLKRILMRIADSEGLKQYFKMKSITFVKFNSFLIYR